MGNVHRKRTLGFLSVLVLLILLVGAPLAHAVPALQLDIAGGDYDTATQTIMTSSNTFTLYALVDPTQISASRSYFISAALEPITSSSANLGSFSFNGTSVNATSGMTYGTPPLEIFSSLQGYDAGDLAPHGVYPTYFREFEFTFNPVNTSGIYNTAETSGGIQAGSGLLYAAFTVDTTLLRSPYQLHFDLYSERILQGDIDVKNFAPFSHDAGTNSTTRGVPEPNAALLMGIGLVGFGLWQRRRGSLLA